MPKILVVEDDKLLGLLLAEMLEGMDFNVCAIETTQSGAVEAALRLRPDLMIVDARLGRGSGLAAIAEIERHGPMPHILMSGDKLESVTQGTPTLVKPFGLEQLMVALRQLLDIHALS